MSDEGDSGNFDEGYLLGSVIMKGFYKWSMNRTIPAEVKKLLSVNNLNHKFHKFQFEIENVKVAHTCLNRAIFKITLYYRKREFDKEEYEDCDGFIFENFQKNFIDAGGIRFHDLKFFDSVISSRIAKVTIPTDMSWILERFFGNFINKFNLVNGDTCSLKFDHMPLFTNTEKTEPATSLKVLYF